MKHYVSYLMMGLISAFGKMPVAIEPLEKRPATQNSFATSQIIDGDLVNEGKNVSFEALDRFSSIILLSDSSGPFNKALS